MTDKKETKVDPDTAKKLLDAKEQLKNAIKTACPKGEMPYIMNIKRSNSKPLYSAGAVYCRKIVTIADLDEWFQKGTLSPEEYKEMKAEIENGQNN